LLEAPPRAIVDAQEGDAVNGTDFLGVAFLMLVAAPILVWRAMPVPERIPRNVVRAGQAIGLVCAVVVGTATAVVVFGLILGSLHFAWNTVP
jgi:hypothetical protein